MSDQAKQTGSTDPRVQAALREYLERVDRGEAVNRDEFLTRNVEIAGALRSFFAAEEPLRKMAATKISDESSSTSTRSFAARGQETVPPRLQPDRSPGTTGGGLQGQFGRYRIIRALGRGAMGAVYLAEDSQLERKVAIKTPHFEDDRTGELVARFYREARAAAMLRHAGICPVHDVGEIDGKYFISMAYIEGRSLFDLIHGGKTQNERKILIAVHKLAQGLQHAHDHGIVHRDLKPANVMIDKQGEPIIMDFGLARKRRKEGEASLTQSGVILGSPAYMSPEQIEGDPESVGPATDQYSLGVVLYEMLTGQLPFRGSVMNVLAQIITNGPTPPSELRPGLDPRIEAACLRMMAKKASGRFPSMKAVADELAVIVKNPAPASTDIAPIAPEQPPTASGTVAVPASSPGDAAASQVRRSLKQKALTETDVTSLVELVRKCLSRCDYDQVIQIIERIPENRRNDALRALLETAREKVDAIAFLICEVDEADRRKDAAAALRKAEELLKINPGHHRAQQIQEKYSGYGEGAAVRVGPLSQFAKPWHEGGWIPWSALAFGLGAFSVVAAVIIIWLGRTAIVIDANDPGIAVEVNDRKVTIKPPGEQSIQVEPGNQAVKVSYAGLETVTKSFTLTKGKTRRLRVRLLDNKLVADLEGEVPPPSAVSENKNVAAAPTQPKGVFPGSVPAHPSVKVANPPPQSDGFVPLFNGKDLSGWTAIENGSSWKVEEGTLIGEGSREGGKPLILIADQAKYKNFKLQIRILEDERTRIRAIVRRSAFGSQYTGYGIALADLHRENDDLVPRGSVHRAEMLSNTAALHWDARATVSSVASGHWHTVEITAIGSHITTAIDHTVVADYEDKLRPFESGGIALVGRSDATVRIKEIKIEDLSINDRGKAGLGERAVSASRQERASPLDDQTTFARPVLVRGDWSTENGELVQSSLGSWAERTMLVFGDQNLSNFNLTLDFKKTGGFDGTDFWFHWHDGGHYEGFALGAHRQFAELNYTFGGRIGRQDGLSKPFDVETGRWYAIRLEIRGARFSCFVDDNLIFESSDPRFVDGRIGLATWSTAARFRNIKVTDPAGKVLWQGLPDLASHPEEDGVPIQGSAPRAFEGSFTPLYNGADLTNWTFPYGGEDKWTSVNGVIHGTGDSRMVSIRKSFKDFHLRMSLRTSDEWNKHLVFRSNDNDVDLTNYRFDLGGIKADRNTTWPPGTYHVKTGGRPSDASRLTEEDLSRLAFVNIPILEKNKWHRIEMIANKNTFRLFIDGGEISAFRDDESRLSEGQIAIGLLSEAQVDIRDIEINEPPEGSVTSARKTTALTASSLPSETAEHRGPAFVNLFNGKDFSGWRFPFGNEGEWTVANKTLIGKADSTGGSPPSSLHMIESSSSNYENFHLRLKVRNPDQINKWFVFRLTGPPDDMQYYRFDTGGEGAHQQSLPLGRFGIKTGGVGNDGSKFGTDGLATITQPSAAPLPDDGEFHDVEVIAKENEFKLLVDGKLISEFRDDQSRFRKGAIAINLRPGARIEIGGIEIQDLSR